MPYNFRTVNNIYIIRPLLHCLCLFNTVLQVQDGLLFLVTLKLIKSPCIQTPRGLLPTHKSCVSTSTHYQETSPKPYPICLSFKFFCSALNPRLSMYTYRKDTALVKIKHILLLEFHTGVAPRSTPKVRSCIKHKAKLQLSSRETHL